LRSALVWSSPQVLQQQASKQTNKQLSHFSSASSFTDYYGTVILAYLRRLKLRM